MTIEISGDCRQATLILRASNGAHIERRSVASLPDAIEVARAVVEAVPGRITGVVINGWQVV